MDGETRVLLREADSENWLYVFAGDSTQETLNSTYPLNAALSWLSDSKLQIAYARGAKLRTQLPRAFGVELVYKEVATETP